MRERQKAIVWFDEVTRKDVPTVGGKGANLGEMTRAKIPVPPGFIVTANAYFDFLKQAKLLEKIRELLKPLDPNDSRQLQQIAANLKQLISDAKMPPELATQIKEAYNKMGGGLVAVRSSATAAVCALLIGIVRTAGASVRSRKTRTHTFDPNASSMFPDCSHSNFVKNG